VIPFDGACTNHNAATFVSGSLVLHISFDVLCDFCDTIPCVISRVVLCGGKFYFYCGSAVYYLTSNVNHSVLLLRIVQYCTRVSVIAQVSITLWEFFCVCFECNIPFFGYTYHFMYIWYLIIYICIHTHTNTYITCCIFQYIKGGSTRCYVLHGKDTMKSLKSVGWHKQGGGKLFRCPRNLVQNVHDIEQMHMM
jgi:hypothetical protein